MFEMAFNSKSMLTCWSWFADLLGVLRGTIPLWPEDTCMGEFGGLPPEGFGALAEEGIGDLLLLASRGFGRRHVPPAPVLRLLAFRAGGLLKLTSAASKPS